MGKDIEKKALDLQAFHEDMLVGWEPSTLVDDFFENLRREEEVRRLKEIYPKRYLLEHNLVT